MINYYVALFISLYFISCNNKDTHVKYSTKAAIYQDCLRDWNKDKEGCLNIRSIKLFERINREYKLIGKNKKEVLSILGESNTIEMDSIGGKPTEIYSYFIKSICKDNLIIRNSDKCYVALFFQKDILVSCNYLCE